MKEGKVSSVKPKNDRVYAINKDGQASPTAAAQQNAHLQYGLHAQQGDINTSIDQADSDDRNMRRDQDRSGGDGQQR